MSYKNKKTENNVRIATYQEFQQLHIIGPVNPLKTSEISLLPRTLTASAKKTGYQSKRLFPAEGPVIEKGRHKPSPSNRYRLAKQVTPEAKTPKRPSR